MEIVRAVSGYFRAFPAGVPGGRADSNRPGRGWAESDEKHMQKERRSLINGLYRESHSIPSASASAFSAAF
jgi:hypothetical protein